MENGKSLIPLIPARRPFHGFTLIEIMAVIVIWAILATVVVVSLAGSNRVAALEDVIQRIALSDRTMRQEARRLGKPITIRFDGSAGKMVREDDGEQSATLFDIPAAISLAQVRTTGADDDGRIRYSRLGVAATYAVALEPRDGPRQWIVVAGLTGEVTKVKDEKEVDAIFELLAPSRDDSR